MELTQKRRELFFTNLLLLGFDANCTGKKTAFVFHKDMFAVPNTTAFEVVTYFLFSKLNEVRHNEFKISWPVFDRKMAQEFRKTCYDYLVKISKECNNGIQFPRLYPTLLITPGGDRFYELYLAFSTYVMEKHIEADKMCQRPLISTLEDKKLRTVREKSTKIATIYRTNEFINAQQVALKHQEHHEKAAEDFEAYYRYIKSKISQLTVKVKESLDALYNQYCENPDESLDKSAKMECVNKKVDEKFKQVFSAWKEIEEHSHEEKALWDIVRSELNSECDEKMTLNGPNYIISMPEILMTKYNKELRDKKVQSLVENGKLSIKNYLNLWAISIKCYADAFEDGKLSDSENMIPLLKDWIKLLEDYSCKIKLLNQKLTEILGDEMGQIEVLEENAFSSENDPPPGFPPFTPTFTFSPKCGKNNSMLPDNFLSLTPSANRLSLMKKKFEGLHAISPLHFNLSIFQNSPAENRGHINPGSPFLAEKLPTEMKFSASSDSSFQNFPNHSLVQGLKETSKPTDLFMSCFSDEKSFPDEAISMDSLHYKSEISPITDKSLVNGISYEFGDLTISSKGTELTNQSKCSFHTGAASLLSEDATCATPTSTSYSFDISSVEKLSKICQQLYPEGDHKTKGEEHNFAHISFSEEEMLEDMTLPPIPFF